MEGEEETTRGDIRMVKEAVRVVLQLLQLLDFRNSAYHNSDESRGMFNSSFEQYQVGCCPSPFFPLLLRLPLGEVFLEYLHQLTIPQLRVGTTVWGGGCEGVTCEDVEMCAWQAHSTSMTTYTPP